MSANQTLEKELKYQLSAKGYARLIREFRKDVIQRDSLVNYYFDTPLLALRKKRFGLRLRTIASRRAVFTLKFPSAQKAKGPKSFKVRHEIEEELSTKNAKALMSRKMMVHEFSSLITQFLKKQVPESTLKKVALLGSMRTIRTKARLGTSFRIEIDRCEMFGKKFYELELETENPVEADRAVRVLMKKCGLRYLPSEKSKLARFLTEWKKKSD